MKVRASARDEVNGWVVLDKPAGMTSTHAVSRLKRRFQRQEGWTRRNARPARDGGFAGRFWRGDKNRAFRSGRRKSLSLYGALGH